MFEKVYEPRHDAVLEKKIKWDSAGMKYTAALPELYRTNKRSLQLSITDVVIGNTFCANKVTTHLVIQYVMSTNSIIYYPIANGLVPKTSAVRAPYSPYSTQRQPNSKALE